MEDYEYKFLIYLKIFLYKNNHSIIFEMVIRLEIILIN